MNVDCSFCDAKYTVNEDLVRGRVAKFRCRRCGGILPVDGRMLALPDEAPADASSSATPDLRSLRPLVISTAGVSSAPPAPLEAQKAPAAAAARRTAEKRVAGARWIGLAGSFGLAIVIWKMLSPAETARSPVIDAAPMPAAAGVEQPAAPMALAEESPTAGSEPVAAPPQSSPPRPTEAATPAARGASAKRAAVETPEAPGAASTSPGMPSSGFLPDPVPETMTPFDRRAALVALDAAGQRAQACKPVDTVGATRVAVTFAPTGKVTTAVVEGPPFAGTRVGGCIAAMLREAAISPFSGGAVTVHKAL
jgi:hypothetical protein